MRAYLCSGLTPLEILVNNLRETNRMGNTEVNLYVVPDSSDHRDIMSRLGDLPFRISYLQVSFKPTHHRNDNTLQWHCTIKHVCSWLFRMSRDFKTSLIGILTKLDLPWYLKRSPLISSKLNMKIFVLCIRPLHRDFIKSGIKFGIILLTKTTSGAQSFIWTRTLLHMAVPTKYSPISRGTSKRSTLAPHCQQRWRVSFTGVRLAPTGPLASLRFNI